MLNINYSNKVFSLPTEAVRACLEEARENHLKALIVLAIDETARAGYPENADSLAASVGLSRRAFNSAVEYWCRVGVLTDTAQGMPNAAAVGAATPAQGMQAATAEATPPDVTPPDVTISAQAADKAATAVTPQPQPAAAAAQPQPTLMPDPSRPQYSGTEIDELVGRRPELKQLFDACEGVLGKLLSPAEHNKLLELSDYLRLPDDYILMLCSYCTASGKGSIPYIYKLAYSLYDEGVTETAALDEYFKERERKLEMMAKLRTLLGIGSRAITKRERECFTDWLGNWKMPYELIEHAYEITINNVDNHKFSIAYMNKILENWHNAGYKTVAEADNAGAEYRRSNDANGVQSSFDTAEFFELALKRSMGGTNVQTDNTVGKDKNG